MVAAVSWRTNRKEGPRERLMKNNKMGGGVGGIYPLELLGYGVANTTLLDAHHNSASYGTRSCLASVETLQA